MVHSNIYLFIYFIYLSILTFRQGPHFVGISMPLIAIPAFAGIAVFCWLASARRRRVEEALAAWNQEEGVARGLHLALGGEGGGAPGDFWASWQSRVLRRGSRWLNDDTTVVMYNKYEAVI